MKNSTAFVMSVLVTSLLGANIAVAQQGTSVTGGGDSKSMQGATGGDLMKSDGMKSGEMKSGEMKSDGTKPNMQSGEMKSEKKM